MDGPSVGDRLKKLKARVEKACVTAGRDPSSVRILAVSKLQSLGKIREAFEEGQKDFAENYAQEALEKIDQLHSMPVDWHFIGRIQSNKVKMLAGGRFRFIHSVDRESVAEALNKLSMRARQDVFLQFNVAGEASKAGANESGLEQLVKFVAEKCPNLCARGLMVMPPLDSAARGHFRRAREVLAKVRAGLTPQQLSQHPLNDLSMGTSADFEDAILEGATWIRVGTDIFGAREVEE
jgi:pyridoxal phosphate enzyme (YggS family)